MAARMSEASVVVCQAGYNTIAELRRIDVRVVCLPALRPADDQFVRAYAFQQESPNVQVTTTSERMELAAILQAALEQPLSQRAPVASNGAYVAAKRLVAIMDEGRLPIAAEQMVYSDEEVTRRMNEYKTMLQTLYRKDRPGAADGSYIAASPFL